MPEGVAALVVSGFLGSGKTTLVRRLLDRAQATGERIAVVSNEFGELGIDQAMLGQGADAYVELEGGCVCCKLSDDLIQTLQMLHDTVHPDSVIVETSGVAMPFDVQMNFWRPPVNEWVGDDMAVVVVNAEQLIEGRDLDGTFEEQVTSADLLLLNKTDLISADALVRADALLRELEPDTPVVHTAHCDVEPEVLFPPDLTGARAGRRAAPPAPRPHSHDPFETTELTIAAGVAADALLARLRALDALRAKGFVETADGLRLVQVVGRRVELKEVAAPPPPELLGRVVVIHRGAGPGTPH